jgi:glycerol-3-phosphate acyltransferase PlsY
MITAICFPVLLLAVWHEDILMYRGFAIATAVLVLLTHHKNISRLLQGNESKMNLLGSRAK